MQQQSPQTMATAANPYDIPIAKPYFTGNESVLLQQAINSGWVSQGPMVQRFETMVADYAGARFGIATTSCTTSLHVSMLIHGIGPGDDVICPSYSFIATANGIRYTGAEPRFVDIDPLTLNLDPVAVEAFIESEYTAERAHKKTGHHLKAILLVHQIGIPADVDAFRTIADRYGLVLIEDAACAIGSRYKDKPVGASGNTSAWSFHPRKLITTGEGGMVLTDDEALADRARMYRSHGASISDLARHKAGSTLFESYDVVGYNYRMSDVLAALGLQQMEQLEHILANRQRVAMAYNAAFSLLDEVEVLSPPGYVSFWNYQSYPLRVKKAGQRDAIMKGLQELGVSSRRGIPPIHQEPVYERGLTLPQTEAVSQGSLFLPIFTQLMDEEVGYIIDSMKRVLAAL